MEDSVFACTKNILWLDPNVDNPENKYYLESLSSQNYNLKIFKTKEETTQFLLASSEDWVIIVGGSIGIIWVPTISQIGNILGVIVFCYDLEKHKQWTSDYHIIEAVVNQFDMIFAEIENISKKTISKKILHGD